MRKPVRTAALIACLVAPVFLQAQTSAKSSPQSSEESVPSMPSHEEIAELTAKAAEKVEEFQKALDSVRPLLDRINPDLYKNDSHTVENARLIIGALKKKGESAYTLVSLLATLDDLSLDASQASTQILLNGARSISARGTFPDGVTAGVVALSTAGNDCYDISELIMHATLRFVAVEEAALSAAFDKKN